MSLAPSETSGDTALRSAQEIRLHLIDELSKSLKVEPSAIDPSASLETLGVDSIMALGIAGGLAEWLDRDVPTTLLWDYRTIDTLAQALAAPHKPRSLPAGIVALQPHGEGFPIFGFGGLAGSPLAFASLASKLGDAQPFYGVAVPGFEEVPGSFNTVEEIVAAMLVTIRQVQPNGPYRLAGYCFGGLLAFEAARQLAAVDQETSLLAIYDTYTRAGRVMRPFWQRFIAHLYFFATDFSHVKRIPGNIRSRLAGKPGKTDPEYWLEQGEVSSTAAERLWKNNSLARVKYREGSYNGPIIWFEASERSKYNAFYKLMPCGGWSLSTTGRVTTVKIPGDHGNLIGPQHATTAADALRPFLTRS